VEVVKFMNAGGSVKEGKKKEKGVVEISHK